MLSAAAFIRTDALAHNATGSELLPAGWKYSARSWKYLEVSVNSPAGIPIFQFKTVIVVAGLLLLLQGIAQVCRCILCMRTGEWMEASADVEETETVLADMKARGVLEHGSEAIDVVRPYDPPDDGGPNGPRGTGR